jgi:hypothetical protein
MISTLLLPEKQYNLERMVQRILTYVLSTHLFPEMQCNPLVMG